MNADVIVVLADGQIVEQGSHEELINSNGKYADLWSKQIFVRPKVADIDVLVDNDMMSTLKIEMEPQEAKDTSTTSTSDTESSSEDNTTPQGSPSSNQKEVESS
jgi:hypothetical protein